MELGRWLKKREEHQITEKDDVMSAPTNIGSTPWNQSYPKRPYVRSKKLLKLVSELDCQLCGSGMMVQAAHTNWGGGKGRSIKSDDNLVAALCMHCHYDIDQGSKWSKRERQQAWWIAHRKTVDLLMETGRWPVDVPLPSETEWKRFL